MKKIKMFAATAMMAIVATAGYFGYSAYEQANLTDAERMMMANLEALTNPPENSNGREGDIDNPQDCTVSESATEGVCFEVWVGCWKIACDWTYEDVQEYAGTQNYCTYTGGPSSCMYHECQRN